MNFPGHIACDKASNSELVVPIFKDGCRSVCSTSTAQSRAGSMPRIMPGWKRWCNNSSNLRRFHFRRLLGMPTAFVVGSMQRPILGRISCGGLLPTHQQNGTASSPVVKAHRKTHPAWRPSGFSLSASQIR